MVVTQVLIIAAFAVAANAQAIVGNSVSGIDYEGGDVNADAPYKAASPEQCQSYCQQYPTADLWELKPAGECWCKIKANTVRTNRQPGVVAGFMLKSCMETDIDYLGGDMGQHADRSVKSPQECQEKCAATAGCKYWTHYEEPSSFAYGCWLKNKKNPPTKKAACISGPVECPVATTTVAPTTAVPSASTPGPSAGCFEFNIAYPHNDIGGYTRAASPEACQVDCQNKAGCILWTFNPAAVSVSGGNECYMKHTMGTRTDKPGKVSGPANCDNGSTGSTPIPEGSDCFEVDIAYPGNKFIKNTNALTPADCQKDCENTAGCVTWTWLPNSVSKGLKEACNLKATSNNRRTKKGAVSGPKTCGVKATAPPQGSTTASPVTEILPPMTTSSTPPSPPPGLGLGVRCNSKSPPCAEPNSGCITYRCKCKTPYVRYPRNGDNCIEQIRLELGTPCTNPGLACSAANSECRAYRCFCKAGYKMSADGQECE